MPYQYLDDMATADLRESLQELLRAATEETICVMVADLATITPEQQRVISLETDGVGMCSFKML